MSGRIEWRRKLELGFEVTSNKGIKISRKNYFIEGVNAYCLAYPGSY